MKYLAAIFFLGLTSNSYAQLIIETDNRTTAELEADKLLLDRAREGQFSSKNNMLNNLEVLSKYRRSAKTRDEKEEDEAASITDRFQMSRKWSRGRFLIYDCLAQHFACVSGEGRRNCRERREFSIRLKERELLPCAPLQSFKTLDGCVEAQVKWMHNGVNENICSLKEVEKFQQASPDVLPLKDVDQHLQSEKVHPDA